ncbi:hypothetical protein ACLESD_01515 [Pyxidicoccus sp. 3LFB2]
MSDDNSTSNFGKPAEPPKKNPKVFGMPVKIDPYSSVGGSGTPGKKKDDAPFDPFAVVIESPKGG